MTFRFKDVMILSCWIAGLICIGGLCWGLTGPLRTSLLQQAINRAWTRTEAPRLLETSVSNLNPRQSHIGTWYSCDDGTRACIFTIIADGIFLPAAAIVDSDGNVEDILPLTAGGQRLLNRVSPGIIQLHIRRIEERND